jgi:VCBS repeat-containing protein
VPAPVVAADPVTSHAITEAANATGSTVVDTASATLSFTDVDLNDSHTVSIGAPAAVWSGGSTLPTGLAASLASALSSTLTDSTHTGAGSVALAFSAADSAFDFLAAGETLTVTYTVTVTDSHGATSSQPVTFTITGTNDAPVVANAAQVSVNENASLTVTAASLIATASDVDLNDTLVLTSVGNAQNGTVSLVNGDAVFKPATGFYGTAHFDYTVSDNHGGTVTATASIVVNPVSAAPTLTVANATGIENGPIALSISTAVTDPADHISSLVVSALPVGTVLTDGIGGHSFTAVAGATQVDVSSWTLAKLAITPPTNFIGSIPLTVTSSSQLANAAPASTTHTLTVTSGLDHGPVAVNDTATVNTGVAKVISVLLNDTDQDALALSVSGTTTAAHGTVTVNADNTVTYTPNAGYTGADTFQYTVSDGHGATSVGTVNLNVQTPENAVAPTLTVGSNTTIVPTDGSAIKTVLTLHAGDVVTFNWNFTTDDYLPFKDFAFATVNGAAFLLSDIQSTGSYGATGVQTFKYTVQADGAYTFGAGVMNDQDTAVQSYLTVDNLQVNGATVQSFENGLTGLNGVTSTTIGQVSVVTTAASTKNPGVALNPTNGTHEAFLVSQTTTESAIESFLGLTTGQLVNIAKSTGNEHTAINVPIGVSIAANAHPDDTFVTVSGAPAGAVFNHGVFDSITNTWKIEATDLGGNLTITTASDYSGTFTLSVTATSVVYGSNTTATTAAQSQVVTVNAASVSLLGTAGNDVLKGGTFGDTIDGGLGNDTLTGGGGNDTFVFSTTNFGKDTVTDFTPGSDMLQFNHSIFADAATAFSHAAQVGSDVVITFDANDTVTLKNLSLTNLHASDFHIV